MGRGTILATMLEVTLASIVLQTAHVPVHALPLPGVAEAEVLTLPAVGRAQLPLLPAVAMHGEDPSGCSCAAADRPLRVTTPLMEGADVREVQDMLRDLGYLSVEPTGVYDDTTEQAVKKFQADRGLAADGIVGPDTWLHLLTAHDPKRVVIPELLELPPLSQLPDQFIVIDSGQLTLTLYRQGRLFRRYHVAVGKPNTPTPLGEWRIVNKAKHWGGGFGSRWLGLDIPWGTYGIHGTNRPDLIGSHVSAGCVRMQNWSVEELYDLVPEGTRVYIVGPVPVRNEVYRGEAGTDVMEAQKSLAALGLYQGKADGWFGPATARAVEEFQRRLGIDEDGHLGPRTLEALGLR